MIVLALHQLSVVITRRSELKQELANRGPNSMVRPRGDYQRSDI